MLSLYGIDWVNLSMTDKLIFLGVIAILIVIGIIDYFYQKHKEKTKCDKI